MTDIAEHLAWPVRLNPAGTDFETVEQDSPAEQQQAATLVLSTPIGSLLDAPEFGVPDATFRPGGADTDAYLAALAKWEPRLNEDIAAGAIIDRAQQIDVTIGVPE